MALDLMIQRYHWKLFSSFCSFSLVTELVPLVLAECRCICFSEEAWFYYLVIEFVTLVLGQCRCICFSEAWVVMIVVFELRVSTRSSLHPFDEICLLICHFDSRFHRIEIFRKPVLIRTRKTEVLCDGGFRLHDCRGV